ncbi:MAG: hypothetical protein HY318_03995 [Armatimonadetes bacterium]|nr:hypothetical protein [Armatimonadota bacterium]
METIDVQAYTQTNVIVRLIRLNARVSFRTLGGWAEARGAIVDTGGPVSFIPRSLWENATHQLIGDTDSPLYIAGTSTTGKLAWVIIRVQDDQQASPSLRIKAYLLPDDTQPLVLGFEDVLTDAVLHSDFQNRTAYMEFRP